ncbi:putative Vacuole membrane protein [Zostera marina]|uniref:Putative Vacuole membrane protein n=1 Tax=Zostera marina TaxID=29655 RepID=A0A0K9PZC6_ZOSMR|nr:putative Vacuole membrane protein [Zostera marina]
MHPNRNNEFFCLYWREKKCVVSFWCSSLVIWYAICDCGDTRTHTRSYQRPDSTRLEQLESNMKKGKLSPIDERHLLDLQNLTLRKQPYRTSKLFFLAVLFYLKKSLGYILANICWLVGISTLLYGLWFFLLNDVLSEEHLQESLQYFKFGVWWVSLGITSSIGLGSGLHTFVLYLGPHIALFTLKTMQCGRVDLKIASYDTIQFQSVPSWLEKDCSDFGPPLYPSISDTLVRIPFQNILSKIHIEAILWGLGTALGELPPYFISRAALMSERKTNVIVEFNEYSCYGFISSLLNQIKKWLFSHLNFITILVLASVPNPLFDLVGIMCGQFGIPFWQFFLATLIGKAIIKTYIQSTFIIILCNNQLLELMENELIWIFNHIPGLSFILLNMIRKLHKIREAYLSAQVLNVLHVKDDKWKMSLNLIWNTVLCLMLTNFLIKIIGATAQRQLRRQQEFELKKKQHAKHRSNKKHAKHS